MLVYKAEVKLPDNATFYEIEEAKIKAEWKFEEKKNFARTRWREPTSPENADHVNTSV